MTCFIVHATEVEGHAGRKHKLPEPEHQHLESVRVQEHYSQHWHVWHGKEGVCLPPNA